MEPLHIVGGVYRELCYEPHWDDLYGSGGRAAAALSALSPGVRLSTYVDEEQLQILNVVAATFQISITHQLITTTPTFSYEHGLSRPTIWPHDRQVDLPHLEIEGESILRFGFIEGDARVTGRRVVYDPQSPFDPQPFHANGSKADRLAIVANEREVVLLAGGVGIDVARDRLFLEPSLEVVVVKRGIFGALVMTRDTLTPIPVYRTTRVFPIGSGDVFSAAFAYYWAVEELDPVAAADSASLATAYYCDTRVLPVPKPMPNFSRTPITVPDGEQDNSNHRVYLAGPFFSTAQRWLINEVRTALKSVGLEVFSPYHDVGIGDANQVAPADLAGLDTCKAVLALVDGLDAGTLFEVGYARAQGIPVVALAQTVKDSDLTMLRGTECTVVEDIASAVYQAGWAALGE